MDKKRVGFLLKVRPEWVASYKERHQDVWPEMKAALRSAGWHNYSLFMRPDGLLFGYLETPESFEAAQARMAEMDVNARWQAQMAPFFELPEGAKPDEMMLELEEVFHLD